MDISDINCVYEGDLVEMDPQSFLPRFKVHAFLLHDSMVIASIIQNRYVIIGILGLIKFCLYTCSSL